MSAHAVALVAAPAVHNTGPRWDFARCQTQPHCYCQPHGGDVWERCCACGDVRYVPGSGHAQGPWQKEVGA